MLDLSKLITEKRNPESHNLDTLSIPEILRIMNREDQKVALAVAAEIPIIGQVVQAIVSTLSQGGRLFFCGAGTSGRLAIMEAAECPPTFSTPPELIQGIMAGFPTAFFRAVEGAEDKPSVGEKDAQEKGLTKADFLLGISASGRTPYVEGAIHYAKSQGGKSALLCSSRPEKSEADWIIAPETGSEVLTGSTRLKAATAAKMVLNMMTTTSMVALGKVYGNLMVDLNPNSEKLVDRGARIIMEITHCPREEALSLMKEAKNAKVAIVMQMKKVGKEKAEELLKTKSLRQILETS